MALWPVTGMLDRISEHAVTIYVPGSVQWSNKHVKSYSHPRARVHTDQDDFSPGQLIRVSHCSIYATLLYSI